MMGRRAPADVTAGRSASAAVWLFAGASLLCTSGVAEAAGGQSVTLGLAFGSTYSDNILQYSDAQLALFQSGLKPSQFSIDASDDLLLGPSASLLWSKEVRPRRSRSLRVRWSGQFHKKNATADLGSYSATWRESFSRDRRLTIFGYWLPDYYLRQLYDEDVNPPYAALSKYRRAQFDLAIGTVSWRQRIAGRTRAELEYRYEHRAYNHDFVERTSGVHQGELGLEFFRLPARGTLNVYGAYRVSNAKGSDADSAADPDVSYHGVIAGLGWRVVLARQKSWGLGADLGYELGTRAYDSKLPSDKFHHGRSDVSHTVDAGLRLTLPARLGLRGFYQFATNSANLATSAPPSSDTGSYTENEVGLSLDWSAAIWRQSGGAGDGDQE